MGTYDGATFTAFSGKDDGAGTFTLVESDLTNLAVKPATNDSSNMALTVSVTEQEAGADPSGAVTETLSVTVNPVSDEATLTFKDSSGADISANVT